MSTRTTLHWRLDDGPWQERDAGWENTPVDRYVTVRGLNDGPHSLSVRLSNPRGRSPVKVAEWTQ
jgi:hypothetical protein